VSASAVTTEVGAILWESRGPLRRAEACTNTLD
jgi:hypothetical protein